MGNKMKVYRMSVPVDDYVTNEWLEKQSNSTFSLRVLIKTYVAKYGYSDITCQPFSMLEGEEKETKAEVKEEVKSKEVVKEKANEEVEIFKEEKPKPILRPKNVEENDNVDINAVFNSLR